VTEPSAPARRAAVLAAVIVAMAAIVPYLPSLNDYFVRDDFGVVQLLAQKPAAYFPRWVYSSWMDHIWGYTPDEIRPFPAVSYQLTALGGHASPFLHHALNVLLHAANGLLILAIARTAASLSLPWATFAAVVFVLLPVHTESVAWITGRVDSMPAFFYLASFLAYVRWRLSPSGGAWLYAAAIAIFFVALFTKQNTITMIGTLVAYDVLVQRRIRPSVPAVLVYVPFVVLTAGYLWLRYLLFGQVAREGSLNARALHDFGVLFNRHLTHVVVGSIDGSVDAAVVCVMAVVIAWVATGRRDPWKLIYFGPVWWLIGIAPVLVAGYSSPRHVYLAAAGWALSLALVLEQASLARGRLEWRRAIAAVAVAVVAWYGIGLQRSVREWNVTAAVSHKAVIDVRGAALTMPEGSLLIVGAPDRSWEWALPYSVRPPFVRADLGARVFIISPRALSCCPSQWFEETRAALTQWSAGAARESAVALRWDAETGALSRSASPDMPQLPALARALLDMRQPDELDTNLRRMLLELVH
jgi:hypothetical protein